ncbi:MAG: hypothetical protein O3B95_12485 [Chloroflexi bacterium]|nr:hypothetical protein [Chloroflexota bacterium]
MTTLRLYKREKSVARWNGHCRIRDCGKEFRVISDHWQTKVEVLSVLSGSPHRKEGHIHGPQLVGGFQERGGE